MTILTLEDESESKGAEVLRRLEVRGYNAVLGIEPSYGKWPVRSITQYRSRR
jgi:hypothetical protein